MIEVYIEQQVVLLDKIIVRLMYKGLSKRFTKLLLRLKIGFFAIKHTKKCIKKGQVLNCPHFLFTHQTYCKLFAPQQCQIHP